MQSKSLNHLDKETRAKENGRFLRNVLKANAVFSTVSGVVFILFANNLAALLEPAISPVVFVGIGLVILPFAVYVYKIATMEVVNARLVWIIIALDVSWVIASAALLLTDLVPLTTTGKWVVGFSAEIVATFAVLEYVGLRKMRR